jgi:hypothetical protein
MNFIVRVQPAFPGMPQAPGMGAPTDVGPDTGLLPPPGDEMAPGDEMMDGAAPGDDGQAPPWADDGQDQGEEDGGQAPPEDGPGAGPPPSSGKDDSKPGKKPGKKKSSAQLYTTLAGDQLAEADYVRHLAVLHSGASPAVLAQLRREAGEDSGGDEEEEEEEALEQLTREPIHVKLTPTQRAVRRGIEMGTDLLRQGAVVPSHRWVRDGVTPGSPYRCTDGQCAEKWKPGQSQPTSRCPAETSTADILAAQREQQARLEALNGGNDTGSEGEGEGSRSGPVKVAYLRR